MTQNTTVYIDSELKDLIPGYIERMHQTIGKMREMCDQGNFDGIRVLGHNLKGSGGGYGFQKVSDLGKNIEHAAASEDPRMVLQFCRELESFLENVIIHYVSI